MKPVRNAGVLFLMKSPQRRSDTAEMRESISFSASALMRATFSPSLRSKIGVHVSGIRTQNLAERDSPFLPRISSAYESVLPGVVP